jgi:hypothetical protein
LYDGLTGIVTDPYKGAKKEGGVGFVKGMGRGIMSVPFRVMGGAWAVPGYAMKGLYQEMVKSKGNGVQNYIIAARIAQGYDESTKISERERADIVSKWKIVKVGMKKKKAPGGDTMESLHSLVNEKRLRKNDRQKRVDSHLNQPETHPSLPPNLSQQNSYQRFPDVGQASTIEPGIRSNSNAQPAWRTQDSANLSRASSAQQQQDGVFLEAQLIAEEEAERRELEAAIAASVAETSRGNPDEDQLISGAIRASIAELERSPVDSGVEDEEAALKRAIQASIEEAGRSGATEEEQHVLEETLRQSLLDVSRRRQHGSDSEWDSSDTEDNADFQRIIAESKELTHLQQNFPQDYQNTTGVQGNSAADLGEDDELKRVLEESEKAEKERLANADKQKSDDEIVMEYIKKQSLMEEEHRQRLAQGRDTVGESSGGAAGNR